ncbi:MAG TPA: cytochrome c peroxidase [Methylophilaceae bacterium]|nr:cytochrome c peroxidase [Methylophilaceae bacterium]
MRVRNVLFIFSALIIAVALYMAYKKSGIGYEPYPKGDALGLPAMIIPENNPLTAEKVALGRKLFMDRRLSHNNTISCAMCHVPEQGFVVNEIATAVGLEGRTNKRNAPTIFNVGYYKHLFHDGREFSLENQIIGPLLAENEMGNPSIGFVIEKIDSFPDYQGLFEQAFDGQKANLERVSLAIASYERTMVSGNSKFDQWYFGKNKAALNEREINGFRLFSGKANCISCHTVNKESALFTDQSFHNTGAGWNRNNKVLSSLVKNEVSKQTFPVSLAPGITVEVANDHFDKASEVPKNDVGRFEVTSNPNDSWLYKTPSLRNIQLTAPYMHDGSLRTLDNVVDFYNVGGEDNPYKDQRLVPLGLTQDEKADLVAFMKALTGSNVKRLEKEARDAYFEAPVP